jgi:hypothetical protein
VSIAVEILGDGLIGGQIGIGGAEDDAAAEDEGLWGGPSPDERFELPADIGGQVNLGTEGKWHGSLRANREKSPSPKGLWRIDPGSSSCAAAACQLAADLRNGHLGLFEFIGTQVVM